MRSGHDLPVEEKTQMITPAICNHKTFPILYDGNISKETEEKLVKVYQRKNELPDDALLELFRRLRRLIIKLYQNYLYRLPMEMDDYDQEALILLWEIVMTQGFRPEVGTFSNFYAGCWERRLKNLWRNYALYNPVLFQYEWDWGFKEPLGDSVYVWDESYIQNHRQKKREGQRAIYRKKDQEKVA